MPFLSKTKEWYSKFERPISSFSLIAGFVVDSLTLNRVDTIWENVWISMHILIVGLFIILIHKREMEQGDEKDPEKRHFWYLNILQFFFGGLLSACLVLYFKSADIFVAWPFVLILAVAFTLNETLKHHYVRFSFQMSLYYLAVYAFFIFLVPVVFHQVGPKMFLLSGFVSLVYLFIFIIIFSYLTKETFTGNKKVLFPIITGVFALMNILYFSNLIPPLPLALKEGGAYHSIIKNKSGNYDVLSENHDFTKYLKIYQSFSTTVGSPVYVYSAIFSPKNLNLNIVHEWQHFDSEKNKWVTESTIHLSLVGGRSGGFRTYSMRSNIKEGKWRVNVKTETGQIIGRVRFYIQNVLEKPILHIEEKI